MTGRPRIRLVAPCLLLAPLLLSGCGIFDTLRDGLFIESHTETVVIGDTMRVSIELLDGSTPPPTQVLWRSSDESIAVVDEAGLVTATGVGLVEISASAHGLTAFLPLWVWELAPPFVALAVGAVHSCGLDEEGRVWCWGANWDGQLGSPSVPDLCLPSAPLPCATGALPAPTDLRFESLALGGNHSCGITASGTAYCWGSNGQGQLGDGGTTSRWAPEPVSGDHVFRSLAAGDAGTCGITEHDELLCWGSSPAGPFGSLDGPAATPARIATEHRFIAVSTASHHTCALTADGVAWCWGRNEHGQLGVEDPDRTSEPQRVVGVPPFVDLALAGGYSCGLSEDGTAYCWGRNDDGQLGDGTTDGRWEARPVLAEGPFSTLTTGSSHGCGLNGEARLFCWGRDRGAFGTGEEPFRATEPLRAAPGLTFISAAVGPGHTCAVAETGTTWCWGNNLFGTLGRGRSDRLPLATPERVVRRTDVP